MIVNLHIERLIVDGALLAASGRSRLQGAVSAELTRLLATDGFSGAPPAGGAHETRRAALRAPADGSPTRLGRRIARAVHEGLRP